MREYYIFGAFRDWLRSTQASVPDRHRRLPLGHTLEVRPPSFESSLVSSMREWVKHIQRHRPHVPYHIVQSLRPQEQQIVSAESVRRYRQATMAARLRLDADALSLLEEALVSVGTDISCLRQVQQGMLRLATVLEEDVTEEEQTGVRP